MSIIKPMDKLHFFVPKTRHCLIVFIIFSWFSLNVLADENEDQDKWYEIEILIFSNQNVSRENEENWAVFKESWAQSPTWELLPALPEAELPDMLDMTVLDRSGEIRTLAESRAELAEQENNTGINAGIEEEQINAPTPETANAPIDENTIVDAEEVLPETENRDFPHFEQVAEEDLQLVGLAEKLAKANEYNLLLHTGWRQPVKKGAEMTPVYLDESISSYQADEDPEDAQVQQSKEEKILNALLQESQRSSDEFTRDAPLDSAEGNAQNNDNVSISTTPVNTADQIYGPDLSIIHGTANLRLSRFLHFGLNLVYRAPEREKVNLDQRTLSELFPMMGSTTSKGDEEVASMEKLEILEETQAAPPLNGYELKITRRVKSKELHFFDHPHFAAIVRLIPWEPPEIDAEQLPQQSGFSSSKGRSVNQFKFGSL